MNERKKNGFYGIVSDTGIIKLRCIFHSLILILLLRLPHRHESTMEQRPKNKKIKREENQRQRYIYFFSLFFFAPDLRLCSYWSLAALDATHRAFRSRIHNSVLSFFFIRRFVANVKEARTQLDTHTQTCASRTRTHSHDWIIEADANALRLYKRQW